MSHKLERIADDFGLQMKKGFIRALILLILNDLGNKGTYGVKIIEEIKKRTLGVWKPTPANIYPLLNSLRIKGLIKVSGRGEKNKKKYVITPKGEKILRILIRKYQKIVQSMRSVITSVFGFDVNYMFEDFVNFLPNDPVFGWVDGQTIEEKLENLNYQKSLIEERILYLKDLLKDINREISQLESGKI